MCGEQKTRLTARITGRGSPPRVRGTAPRMRGLVIFSRITPACAGNSFPLGSGIVIGRDHPRVCGEQDDYLARGRRILGSPPRVRGTD